MYEGFWEKLMGVDGSDGGGNLVFVLAFWLFSCGDSDDDNYHYPNHHHYQHTIILVVITIITIKPRIYFFGWGRKIRTPQYNFSPQQTPLPQRPNIKVRKPYLIYMSLSWVTFTRYLSITAVKRWRDISSEIHGQRNARWRVIGGNDCTFGGNGGPLRESFWFVNGVCVLLSFLFFGGCIFFYFHFFFFSICINFSIDRPPFLVVFDRRIMNWVESIEFTRGNGV